MNRRTADEEWPDEPRQPGRPTKEQATDAFLRVIANYYVGREVAAKRGETPTGPEVPSDDD